jgi:hypothetical protein
MGLRAIIVRAIPAVKPYHRVKDGQTGCEVRGKAVLVPRERTGANTGLSFSAPSLQGR